MSLNAGQTFAGYRIIEMIGRGGMGEVYLAKDSHLERSVAIKILTIDPKQNFDSLARFKREARVCASLNHPGICTILDVGDVDGCTYICMEYVEGKNLRDLISETELPTEKVLEIAIQIADALEEARKKNIVHRDIKSSNIVLTPRDTVKILDFGLAKRLHNGKPFEGSQMPTESSITRDGTVHGTIAYMAPEQAYGKEVDHRCDIFSFGVVIYEMLTGRLPFTGKTITEVIDSLLHQTPPPVTRFNSSVPEALVRVLNKMLEKDPEMRYQSVHEVWADLKRIKAGNASRESLEIPAASSRRNLLLVTIPVLLAVLFGLAYLLHKKQITNPVVPVVKKELVPVAVLPFQYTGTDPDRDYLSGLVTDGLIASLRAIPNVTIAPFANVREITAQNSNQKVARDLSVNWIIRGTVSAKDQIISITPEIFSADGTSVWKQTISGRPVQTLDLTAKNILKILPVSTSDSMDVQKLRTPNLLAYQKYLEGRDREQGWDVETNVDQAVVLYQEALKEDPDFAAAHAGLAMAFLNQYSKRNDPKLLSAAAEESRHARALDPNLPEALLAYGAVQVKSGNFIEAQDAFDRALQFAPGDDAPCRALAHMYASIGKNAEAKQMYERTIALRPNYWMNHYLYGTFNWQYLGDLEGARVQLESANELHPTGFAPVVMLGNIHLTQGQLEQAETYFRRALELSKNPYAYNNLGLVHYYRGQYDLALRNWQTLLKETPDKPLYRANVADALRQLGRTEEAEKQYKKVISRFRSDLKTNRSDETRSYLSMALAAIGECVEAKSETRGLLARHPKSPVFGVYAAITASRCEDFAWAKQIVIDSIASDNLLTIRFDPDLKPVRELDEIKAALIRAGVR